MHFIVKLFPEIIVKSPPVRKRLNRRLGENLRKLLEQIDPKVIVKRDWEKIEVLLNSDDPNTKERCIRCLEQTPGIAKFSQVICKTITDLDSIKAACLEEYREQIAGKTFVVRAKRNGKQILRTNVIEPEVGGHLLHNSEAIGVNLKHPDFKIELEVRGDQLFMLSDTWKGLGGYPIGSQDSALSLISGGFDSSVSSYMSIKRGLLTHFLFFNLGGRAHEIGVKEVAHHIWQNFGSSHKVMFITVPFEEVIAEISTNTPRSYMGVMLKRMMLRTANAIAKQFAIDTLITGEAVGQVSSQTLANLQAIDQVSDAVILRPLILTDKEEIIRISRKIGTEAFAAAMPEFCGVNSSNPTTKAKMRIIEDTERTFDMSTVEYASTHFVRQNIDEVLCNIEDIPIDVINELPRDAVVIDVRHPTETEKSPFLLSENQVIEIPYFKLGKKFPELDRKTRYLLWCDKGVMSRLHAELLISDNHRNIGVYRPSAHHQN